MASSVTLADIEERFFWCSVCLEPFKEPRQLPCLHRYCRHCLKDTIIADKKDSILCPLCQQKHRIPKDGVDGFKSDFHIKRVVEFLQLPTSFRLDDVKSCLGCKEAKRVVAYCFKCKSFLCQQCYDFHLSNDMIADHRQHTLNLEEAVSKRFTLERLASLTEDPRCTTHVKHLAQLCCETCGNLPICVACTYGGHKGHKIHDVKVLAPTEREKLNAILTELNKYKDNLYKLPKRVESRRQKLKTDIKLKLEKAEAEYKLASKEIAKIVEENRDKLEEIQRKLKAKKEKDCYQVKQECEREMEKVKQKYDGILKKTEAKYDKKTKQFEWEHCKIEDKLLAKIDKLSKELKDYKEKVQEKQRHNQNELQEIQDHAVHTISRYENFTATSSTVLASNDEWTDARCLPDITAASEPLIRDVKREFKELDSLSDVKMGDLTLVVAEKVSITENQESEHCFNTEGIFVVGMTSSGQGHIIITGHVRGGEYSHITVISRWGRTIRQSQIELGRRGYGPSLHCASLSQARIATACHSNKVGIYDVSNGKYVEKDFKHISISWSQHITCVATDTMDIIYVGGRQRDILVFDDELKYQHTLRLPEIIKYPFDMTVHDGHLLICDASGRMAYAVNMEGQEAKLVCQFPKPTLDHCDWWPYSVCTDSNQYIYMLWESTSARILTQYSQDGCQLLTTRRVNSSAQCLTSLMTDNGEKLVIATFGTGKLYTYGLRTF